MKSLKDEIRSRLTHGNLNDAIISSKLHIPPLKSRLLLRTHLVKRLLAGKDCPIILISSMAGSGKTTLACQWIEEGKLPAAWYSIDKLDNEPDIFFRYFLRALGNVDERLLSEAKLFLEREKKLLGGDVITFVIQHLTTSAKELYLVLDDYHFITASEIHDALLYFIEHLPEKTHVVIISRYAVPFSLSRFRVRDQIMEIFSEDMNFSESETAQFFSEFMPVDLSDDQVLQLARYTEGWVGGLQLLGLSLKGKSTCDFLIDIQNGFFKESLNYLMDEVVNAQPENIRDFLHTTAFLERFNTDLCREITGRPDTRKILDHLYHDNLFLIPLDTEGIWYRYHQIFSEAIRDQVTRILPNMPYEVHRKSALWFAQNHYLEDAFHHAFASEDFEFAADLMEDFWMSFYDRYDVVFYLRWLAKLPREVINERPLLRLHECSLKIESLQLSDIEAIVGDIEVGQARAFERYRGIKKAFCRDILVYLKGILPYYREQAGVNRQHLDQIVLANLPENKLFCGITKVNIARCYFLQGDMNLAAQALAEASKMVLSSESLWGRMLWCKVASDVERWHGRLHRAEAILKEGFSYLERKGLHNILPECMLFLPMAWMYYLRNDLEKAIQYVNDALRYAEEAKAVYFVIEAEVLRSFICAAIGDAENADKSIQNIYRLSRATGIHNLIVSVDACVAYPYIARGDLGWLEQWVDRRKRFPNQPFSFPLVLEKLVEAGLLYRKERYREAAYELETLRQCCVNRNMMLMVMDVDLLHATTLYAYGDYGRAMEIMKQVLIFSEAEWYIQPFAAYAPIIADVLAEMVKKFSNCQGSSFIATIMKACGIADHRSVVSKGFKRNREADLTPREFEILKLIAAGYRNKEIAKRAFISIDTVKTHSKHIFEKLDVKTRVQAIRQAEELGLFDNC